MVVEHGCSVFTSVVLLQRKRSSLVREAILNQDYYQCYLFSWFSDQQNQLGIKYKNIQTSYKIYFIKQSTWIWVKYINFYNELLIIMVQVLNTNFNTDNTLFSGTVPYTGAHSMIAGHVGHRVDWCSPEMPAIGWFSARGEALWADMIVVF